MITKICSVCKKEKPITDFHKDKRGVFGVRADCKECRSLKTRKPKELQLPRLTQDNKICERCSKEYKPSSNRQKYCTECQREIDRERMRDYYRRTYKPKGYSHLTLHNANGYKTGIGIYQKLKRMSMTELKCERCGSQHYLLVHHKDRNRHNNDVSNLELLCKSCHQKEHIIRDSTGKFIGSR